MQPKEYKAIQEWGDRLGSYQWYIDEQQQHAARDNAPVNSVYFSKDEQRWITTDDLHHVHPMFHWQQKK